jgi:glycosyltransferase involved in cell wall biosynthesis
MSPESNPRHILYVVDDYGACGWYRCHVPGMELKRQGHDVVLDDVVTLRHVHEFDVIVLQRQWRPEAVEAADYARSLGKTIVYELDDDIWNLHPSNPAYEAWNDPRLKGAAEYLIRSADAVTTTTAPLARQLRKLSSKVRILPNMLPDEHWQVRRERPEGYAKVIVGWAGSVNRGVDLNVVGGVVFQLLERYPHVEFALAAGDDPASVFPAHPRIRNVPVVKIEQYARLLTQFDVGIAPIVDSRFNQAKSDLKFVEYGMVGLPVVASAVESYVHSIKQGENGFLAKNDKDWLKYLRRLVEDASLRESLGSQARAFAEERTIARNMGVWEDAYGLGRSC